MHYLCGEGLDRFLLFAVGLVVAPSYASTSSLEQGEAIHSPQAGRMDCVVAFCPLLARPRRAEEPLARKVTQAPWRQQFCNLSPARDDRLASEMWFDPARNGRDRDGRTGTAARIFPRAARG